MSPGYQAIIVALIRNRELAPLGFKGITHIPTIEIANIEKREFEECIEHLVTDDVLGSLVNGRSGPYFKPEKLEDGTAVVTVNCRMTANKIREQYHWHLLNAYPLEYHSEINTLYFLGKEISMGPKDNNNPSRLLRALFLNRPLGRTLMNESIWNDMGYGLEGGYEENEKKNSNSIYQASVSINDEIAKKTLIPNFLIGTLSNVTINPVYIPYDP